MTERKPELPMRRYLATCTKCDEVLGIVSARVRDEAQTYMQDLIWDHDLKFHTRDGEGPRVRIAWAAPVDG